MKHNVRSVALEILDAVLTEGAYSNLLINEAIKKVTLNLLIVRS